MTHAVARRRIGWMRLAVSFVLIASLVGAIVALSTKSSQTRVLAAYFASATGLYPGDTVRVAGVPVGSIDSIEPRRNDVKVTMSLPADVPIPADVHAVVMAPNLVAARFIQLAPAYATGPVLPDGASIELDRTATPVEWDEVKAELTKLSAQFGPSPGSVKGPLSAFIDQAADTFDGNGEPFRHALRELSQTAGRLGDARTDVFGTIKNLQVVIEVLSASNGQIVQFSGHLASVSQVLADSSNNLDTTLATLNGALEDARKFLHDNNTALIGEIDKLAEFTRTLSERSEDIEQVLHVGPNALANFYAMYNPAQGSLAGTLAFPDFANPVQFICGSFDAGASPDHFKRAEICRQRMAPVLKRLAMNYPPILFHPINSITAYDGQIIYDTSATGAKAQTPHAEVQWQPAPGVSAPVIPDGTDVASLLVPPAPAPNGGGG
jgi:phospholipid/cholesterol/gamma-HCH transport system substrate-binding protein